MAMALMAVGFAVGGHVNDAEQMTEGALSQGKKVAGGLASWAKTYIYDFKGRVSEGISALANIDGIDNYEGSGFLFFESRLGGYGARFSLDREERGRGKSKALRLYGSNFERVLGYSGYSEGRPWTQPKTKAPLSWVVSEFKSIDDGSSTSEMFYSYFFGTSKKKDRDDNKQIVVQDDNTPSSRLDPWEPSCEDVLTWLPPTPSFVSDATLLLLRFTLNGTISPRNARWDNVRNAWATTLDIQRKYERRPFKFDPLASISASLLFDPSETGGDLVGNGRLAKGLYKMGQMLKLGKVSSSEESQTSVRELIAELSPDFWLPTKDGDKEQWRDILLHMASAIDGVDFFDEDGGNEFASPQLRFQHWDFEIRPIVEHAVVFAACKAGDIDSLSLARAICSRGVTLRPSSPEEWWRYSIVLGLLGDEVASENALYTSINVGGGQGSR